MVIAIAVLLFALGVVGVALFLLSIDEETMLGLLVSLAGTVLIITAGAFELLALSDYAIHIGVLLCVLAAVMMFASMMLRKDKEYLVGYMFFLGSLLVSSAGIYQLVELT